ncbi:hypothetical protein T06_10808 [Trichinella sp. T6]|nr:hypothetical protein T06_10808 [Trichinella sp. T6]
MCLLIIVEMLEIVSILLYEALLIFIVNMSKKNFGLESEEFAFLTSALCFEMKKAWALLFILDNLIHDNSMVRAMEVTS